MLGFVVCADIEQSKLIVEIVFLRIIDIIIFALFDMPLRRLIHPFEFIHVVFEVLMIRYAAALFNRHPLMCLFMTCKFHL